MFEAEELECPANGAIFFCHELKVVNIVKKNLNKNISI